jgi:hypothetical protein
MEVLDDVINFGKSKSFRPMESSISPLIGISLNVNYGMGLT